jgi:hypothetical protein
MPCKVAFQMSLHERFGTQNTFAVVPDGLQPCCWRRPAQMRSVPAAAVLLCVLTHRQAMHTSALARCAQMGLHSTHNNMQRRVGSRLTAPTSARTRGSHECQRVHCAGPQRAFRSQRQHCRARAWGTLRAAVVTHGLRRSECSAHRRLGSSQPAASCTAG